MRVMMSAVAAPLAHEADGVVAESLLQLPAEAGRPVLVNGLEDHQDGAELEDAGANDAR